mmetsp:Transcript_23713/g.35176  ORF Transcript_23713/g.35176 Transcript_23713/m.35176 type:complete len:199 (-) Transcript_23713:111-707(-)
MVVYVLYAKADLQGIASVALIPGANFCISVRNPLYHSEVRENVVIESSDLIDPADGKGKWETPDVHDKHHHQEHPHHFSLKWDGEKERSTIRVLDGSETATEALKASSTKTKKRSNSSHQSEETREIRGEDSGEFVPILAVECQGLEPFAFHPMGGEFLVTNRASVTFDEVDLSEGKWEEYDLATGSTQITNFETKFV